jgi:hypothetical protein
LARLNPTMVIRDAVAIEGKADQRPGGCDKPKLDSSDDTRDHCKRTKYNNMVPIGPLGHCDRKVAPARAQITLGSRQYL